MEPVIPVWLPAPAAAIVAGLTAVAASAVARPLLRAADSPTLPERLLAWSGQHRLVAVLGYVLLIFSGRHAFWAIPLAWLGLQLTAHRVRRRIYGDTWSLGGQIWWNVRAIVALHACWWTIAIAPIVLVSAGAPAWGVVAGGAALLAWVFFYNDIAFAILGATPIASPVHDAAFAPVLARAKVRPPRLMRVGPRGGLLINAFALAAVRRDAVLFFDGLLAETTPAEAAAVLAHEIGHIEDFTARRVRVLGAGPLLVVGGVLLTLATQRFAWPDWVPLSWVIVSFATLLLRTLKAQQRETESDRRAVELCGDGEALIRALITIHARAQIPRRFRPEFAQRATHPSLARRIQAIRALGGAAPEPIAPRAFGADGAPRAVVFEAERLVLVTLADPPPDLADHAALLLRASHVVAIPYSGLSSVHLEPRRDGGTALAVADRHGERHTLRLAAGDLGAVQALLDQVDLRIGPPVDAPQLPHVVGRMAALAAVVAALPLFAWGVVAASLLALVRPTVPILAAVSAGMTATALIAARHPVPAWRVPAFLVIAAAAGVVALRQMRHERTTDAPFRWDGFLLAGYLTAAAAALIPLWLILALGRGDLEQLHVATRAFASAGAGCAAFGGLCLVTPRRLARIGAGFAFTLAAAVVVVGSNVFRDRVVPDPLIASAPALTVDDISASPDGRLTAPGEHWAVTLAPDAQHVLLTPNRADGAAEGAADGPYTVAGFDGWQRTIEADDVQFVDAATLLTARRERHVLTLTTEPVRAAEPRWTLRIDDALEGDLDVAADGRWRLEPHLDVDGHDEAPARLEGRVGEWTIRRIPVPPVDAKAIAPEYGVAASGASIAVTREFTGRWHAFSPLLPDTGWRSVLTRSGGAAPGPLARSRVRLDCYGPSLTSPDATCLAQSGDDTVVWDVSADAGPPRPIAALEGRVTGTAYEDRLLLVWRDGDLLALWRGLPRAVRVSRSHHCPCAHDASYAAGHMVTLTRKGDRDVVVRYPVTAPAEPRQAAR